jgi:hypothetical protein
VQNTIDNHLDLNFIEDLQNQDCENWTPLAETFFVSMLYFAQEDAPSGYDYPSDTVPNTTTADDPYYDQDAAEHVACAKSFVILLTDGASTKDRQIPRHSAVSISGIMTAMAVTAAPPPATAPTTWTTSPCSPGPPTCGPIWTATRTSSSTRFMPLTMTPLPVIC